MKGSQKKRRIVAVVPAAGLGKRFGPGRNKAFQPLCGKPLVVWPLEVLQAVPEIVEIIPVLKIEDMVQGRKIFEEYNLSKIKRIAAGGKERQDSVHNALKLIDDDNCIVLIHDGVRPLIEKELIENAVREMKISTSSHLIGAGKGGFNGINGIIFGVPVKDTIKQAKEGIIKKTLKRDALWAIQTPQVFSYKKVMAAYNQAAKEKFYSTDDSALVEHYGGKIKVVLGSYRNIKVTTPEDLDIAETLLRINSNL
jgi:2-C-methyl-D-erythritol 4-phosphate cytidylyltransferase